MTFCKKKKSCFFFEKVTRVLRAQFRTCKSNVLATSHKRAISSFEKNNRTGINYTEIKRVRRSRSDLFNKHCVKEFANDSFDRVHRPPSTIHKIRFTFGESTTCGLGRLPFVHVRTCTKIRQQENWDLSVCPRAIPVGSCVSWQFRPVRPGSSARHFRPTYHSSSISCILAVPFPPS